MENYTEKPPLTGSMHPMLSILSMVLIAVGFLVIGQLLGLAIATATLSFSLEEFMQMLDYSEISEKERLALFILQGCIALSAFIISPIFYLKIIEKKSLSRLSWSKLSLLAVVLTTVITFSFMPVNSFIIEWNMGLDFPDLFESWFREREDEAQQITQALTNFTSPGYFILAFLVIAIIPAIGEELLFRGLIQNKLWEASNIHVAIWVTGILFGVIHLQFYGVVPRILLGVLFGYLYYWSGTLWVPIIAHFFNNGITLIALYMYNTGAINFDLENQEMPLFILIPFILIFIAALLYFKKVMEQKKNEGLAQGL